MAFTSRRVLLIAAVAAAAATARAGEPDFSPVDERNTKTSGQGCTATTAIDATALGIDTNTTAFSATYECAPVEYADGTHQICWESDTSMNTGDVAWMLFSTTFVMLQTPAAGFAQGGLVRRKNAMSVIGQAFLGVVIGCVLWWIWGYSLTFGPDGKWDNDGDGSFIGNPSTHAFFQGVSAYNCDGPADTIPHLLFALFQMTFSLMVPVLITGAWAEKFHLSSAILFMIIWPHLVYYPTAHWIWGGGWLSKQNEVGVLDYAGGIVIHTSSGVSAFVVAMMLQKRRAFAKNVSDTTHNLPLTMVGVALVWVGWYCFNGGSGLRANGQAVSALAVTQLSACMGAATFAALSYLDDGFVQITHVASGALAGLAGITPCSGFVEVWAGCPIGIMVGLSSWYGAKAVKSAVELDDVLDVTSLQAFPGAVGSLLVGFFATNQAQPCAAPVWPGKDCELTDNEHYGVFYGGDGNLLLWQFVAVLLQIVWSAFFTWVTMMMIKWIRFACGQGWGFDVSPEMEDLGLDKSSHGERAYDIEQEDDEVEESVKVAKLCDAAAAGDADLCRKYVKMGIHPANGDVDGRTALHIAAAKGQLHCVKMFVDELDVDVNAADKWGNTPLREAIRGHHANVIDWLKDERDAKTNETGEDQALFLAAASSGDAANVQALLRGGMDADLADYDGRTALHLAACGGHEDVLQVLLAGGASSAAKDRFGGLAIQDAMRYKHEGCVKLIKDAAAGKGVEFSVDVLRPDAPSEGSKQSASVRELLAAAHTDDVTDLKRLKKKRVNLGLADYDGRTALHVAVEEGHFNVVKFLVADKNVNVNAQDFKHQTPLMGAKDNQEIVQFLMQNGATMTDDARGTKLCKAAFTGDLAAIQAELNAGIDLNTSDYDGRTAMHLAAASGRTDIVKFLVNNKASPAVKDRWGGTPLEDAIRNKHEGTVAALTELAGGASAGSSNTAVTTV